MYTYFVRVKTVTPSLSFHREEKSLIIQLDSVLVSPAVEGMKQFIDAAQALVDKHYIRKSVVEDIISMCKIS